MNITCPLKCANTYWFVGDLPKPLIHMIMGSHAPTDHEVMAYPTDLL